VNYDNTFVKLLPGAIVKTLLRQATSNKCLIDVDDSYFIVRDVKTSNVTFRGIKIKENIWGITFEKKFWSETDIPIK